MVLLLPAILGVLTELTPVNSTSVPWGTASPCASHLESSRRIQHSWYPIFPGTARRPKWQAIYNFYSYLFQLVIGHSYRYNTCAFHLRSSKGHSTSVHVLRIVNQVSRIQNSWYPIPLEQPEDPSGRRYTILF